ncbi:MAG: hypothetical protein QXY37_02200 [Metallosphaera sp.]
MNIYAKILVLIVAFLVTSSPLIFMGSSGPNVYLYGYGWGSPTSPTTAYPGYTEFPFYVEVVATGSATPYEASITTSSNSPLQVVGTNQEGMVQQNGYYLTSFYISVSSSASPGYYPVTLTVDYSEPINGFICTFSKSFTLEVPVSAVNFPVPINVEGGTSGTTSQIIVGQGMVPLTLTVSNPSNNVMDNVIVNLTLPPGVFSSTGKGYLTFNVPSIAPQQSSQDTQMVNVTQEAIPGTYSLNYNERFTNYLGYTYYATNSNITTGNANVTLLNLPLTLTIYPKSPVLFYVSSASATPNSQVSILIKANSTYNYQVLSITPQSQLNLIHSNFTSNTFRSVSVFNFTFQVAPSISPGVYPVTFTTTYQIFGQTQQTVLTTYVNVNYYNTTPVLSDPSWGTQSDQVLPTPGETGIPLSFVLTNPLPYSLSNVNVTFVLPQGMSSPYNSYIVPIIGPAGTSGNSAQVSLTLNLASNVTPGYHYVKYIITYTTSYGIFRTASDIPVYIYPQSQLIASFDTPTIYQGTQIGLPITVTNPGSQPLTSISAQLKVTGLTVVGFTNQTINYLGPGENTTLVFSISSQGVGPGTYPATLLLSYSYEGFPKSSSYTFPINVVPSQDIVSVSVEPEELFYSTLNNVTINLVNNLQEPLYNLELKLIGNPSLYSLSQNSINIGTLKPGETESVTLSILPTVTSTTPIPLSVEVQYLLPQGGVVTEGYNFSLIATGLINLQLEQPTVTFSNGTLTVTGVLNNLGTATANFVTVYVNGNSTYIGSVPPNSPTPFSSTIFIPFSHANSSQEIRIDITYYDSVYQPHNISYTLHYVPTVQHLNFTNFGHSFHRNLLLIPTIIIVILIIVIIILIVLLVSRRFRR